MVSTLLYVTSADGVRLNVAVSGEGPPLVMVHGSLESGTSWSAVVSELEHDFTCFVLDRRGHGDSDDAREYSLQAEARDVIEVASQAGPDAAVLGHSFGAVVVLEALRTGLDVATAVLYEPTLPFSESVLAAHSVDEPGEESSRIVQRERQAMADAVDALSDYVREVTPMVLLEGTNSARRHRDPVGYLARRVSGVRVRELVGQDHFAHRTAPQMLAQVLRELLQS